MAVGPKFSGVLLDAVLHRFGPVAYLPQVSVDPADHCLAAMARFGYSVPQ